MCVLVTSEKGGVPTDTDLIHMHEANPDGIGLAWMKAGIIEFHRGLSLSQAKILLAPVAVDKLPFMLHFRWATVGGIASYLTHPFPITTDQKLLFKLNGKCKYMLAHNGHWHDWDRDIAVPEPKKRYRPWSDSAALAYIASQRKELICPAGNKVATMHVDFGIERFNENLWSKRTGRNGEDFYCSNTAWEYKRRGYRGAYYNLAGNDRPCAHGKYVSCDDCPPTVNTYPVELPNHRKPDKCSYTHSDNGLLLGVKNHGCQHPGGVNGHYHCQFCNRKECREAWEYWLANKEAIIAGRRLLEESERNRKLKEQEIARQKSSDACALDINTIYGDHGTYVDGMVWDDELGCWVEDITPEAEPPAIVSQAADDKKAATNLVKAASTAAIPPAPPASEQVKAATDIRKCKHGVSLDENCESCDAHFISTTPGARRCKHGVPVARGVVVCGQCERDRATSIFRRFYPTGGDD